jgi:hypothetical protein
VGHRGDPTRRAKVDAAVRHAERLVKTSNVSGPVIFRPSAGVKQPAQPPATPTKQRRGQATNRVMELALSELLGVSAIADREVPVAAKAIATPIRQAILPKAIKATRNPTVKSAKKPVHVPAVAKVSKKTTRPKVSKKQERRPTPLVVSKPKIRYSVAIVSKEVRKGAERNASARLAHNEQRCTRDAPPPAPIPPFVQLQRQWCAAFSYLLKFEDGNPDAPDIGAARKRLEDVEAEWERHVALAPGDEGYFAWPSTEASAGSGTVAIGTWQEIGMLGYLGYHVGNQRPNRGSTESAA